MEKKPDKTDIEILESLSAGQRVPEIARRLKIGQRRVYYLITKMKKHYSCYTQDQLLGMLNSHADFKQKSPAENSRA